MCENIDIGRILRGVVKWFDVSKGFGFVVSQSGGPDILLHSNVLRSFGHSSVSEGTEIEMNVVETARGMQATEVLSLTPPSARPAAPLAELFGLDAEEIERLTLHAARVKWFDKAKGFGFANIFGLAEDIFIHIEVLRRSGLADLAPGEAIGLRVTDGKRGKMAVEVQSWDSAVGCGGSSS
ncbi:MAG: cold shock domain-containing protein [Rhodobacteraceae bacterium]|jgi:CspA family cold shock protein|nr:cold shock domain-containing protein [Paracoccaceae bacterium]